VGGQCRRATRFVELLLLLLAGADAVVGLGGLTKASSSSVYSDSLTAGGRPG